MKWNRWPRWILLLGVLGLFSSGANAQQQPIDVLKVPVEQFIAVLKDPQYAGPQNKQRQRDKLRSLTGDFFDFIEMSKRALARNWRRFSVPERKAFANVFAKLLEKTYADQIQSGLKDETVRFDKQDILSPKKALVNTTIVGQSSEIPVDYRMILKNGNWRVYDVLVEGVSLIGNYRNQFSQLLNKESPAELIARLEAKVAQEE